MPMALSACNSPPPLGLPGGCWYQGCQCTAGQLLQGFRHHHSRRRRRGLLRDRRGCRDVGQRTGRKLYSTSVKTDGSEASITLDLSAATTQVNKKDAINTALTTAGITDIAASLDGGTTGKLVFTPWGRQELPGHVQRRHHQFPRSGHRQGGFAATGFANAAVDLTAAGGVAAGRTSTYQFSINGGKAISVQVAADDVATAISPL